MSDRRNVGTLEIQAVMYVHLSIVLRQRVTTLFVDHANQQHVGRGCTEIKIFVAIFSQDRRGKWPEPFAKLDLKIQLFLHFRMAWITENAPVAESPWTELHASLKPADNLPLFQQFGNIFTKQRKVTVFFVWSTVSAAHPLNINGTKFRTQIGTLHIIRTRRINFPFCPRPDIVCCVGSSERSTCITGRRLNPELVNNATFQQFAIGDTVKSNTTSHHQVSKPGQFHAGRRQLEDDLFGDVLNCQGHVHVRLGEITFLLAAGNAEQAFPFLIITHAQTGGIVEVVHV